MQAANCVLACMTRLGGTLAPPQMKRRSEGRALPLAVAAALISALADRPLPNDAVWFGEVSLAGEVRPVAHGPLRLKEAAKLGFAKAFGPGEGAGMAKDHREIALLRNLVDQVMGGS